MMKKIINFLLVLALGMFLGYIFQPTIDKKVSEKAPVALQQKIKNRQNKWNADVNQKMGEMKEKKAEKEQE